MERGRLCPRNRYENKGQGPKRDQTSPTSKWIQIPRQSLEAERERELERSNRGRRVLGFSP